VANDEKFDRFKKCVVDVLSVEPDKVTMEAKFGEDLDADSLDLVELVMALEEEFGIDIPDEDADKMKTVGDAMKYLQEHASA
jgi:acyl carrier protein